MGMKIIGIDPGSRLTGFGVIYVSPQGVSHVSHGIIKLDESKSLQERLLELGSSISQIYSKHKPNIVVVEKIFLGKNADSAFKLGHARGVVIYEAMKSGCECFEYATRVVKKGITGSGGADKESVKMNIEVLLGIGKIEYLDASDALAMAVFHAFTMREKMLYTRATQI